MATKQNYILYIQKQRLRFTVKIFQKILKLRDNKILKLLEKKEIKTINPELCTHQKISFKNENQGWPCGLVIKGGDQGDQVVNRTV